LDGPRLCYGYGVPVRVVVLIGASIVLAGVLVYLFFAVRSGPPAPIAAPVSPRSEAPAPTEAPAREDDPWSRTRNDARGPAVHSQLGKTAALVDPDHAAAPIDVPAAPAPPPGTPSLADDPNLELSTALDEANRFYDRGDYDTAQEVALKLLDRLPGNVRMLRVVVSTACLMGDPDKARRYLGQLPERDKQQMITRCARNGINF